MSFSNKGAFSKGGIQKITPSKTFFFFFFPLKEKSICPVLPTYMDFNKGGSIMQWSEKH